ncbi:MAG TPA: DCC1-like thiol-disulfide oxidoreductase family protein [Terracidiphilus sp.]|nr:DCC1-like thiol-disulfide oxidoreductase family protein [Terracidiphilus sp.]
MKNSFEIGDRLLVAFDGQCGLCNGAVRWLLRRDRRDRLRFVALESPKVAGLLARHELSGLNSQAWTMLVVLDAGGEGETLLVRSDAVVALLKELRQPWPWIGAMVGWIPRAVRDFGYRVVARWRYRIWGRLESCPVPTAEERGRFL